MNSVSVLFFGMFLITGVIYLYLGGYILYGNIKANINKIFALSTCALAIWAFSFAFEVIAVDYSNALLWRKVAALGWGTFYAFMLNFFIVLLKNSSISKSNNRRFDWKYILLYIPAVISVYMFGIFSEISTQFYNLQKTQFGWRNIAGDSVWDKFFYSYYISYCLFGLVLLVVFSRRTSLIREKKQANIIVTSLILSFVLGSITDVVLDYFTNINLPESGVIFLLIPTIATWFTIRKHGTKTISLGTVSEDILVRMREGLLLMDSNGLVISTNKSFLTLTGFSQDDIIGKKPIQFIKSFDNKEFTNSIWNILLDSDIDGAESLITLKNGITIPVIISSTRITNQWAEIIGIVCIITNLTEVKARENELLITKKELEIALSNANVAIEAKTQFLATISHEIKTPMNTIIGMSYLTSTTPLSGQQKEYIGKIQKSAGSLLEIVNNILGFSKIESGKVDLDFSEFDIDIELSKTIGRFSDLIYEKGLMMLYHFPKDMPQNVIGDVAKFNQVISILVDNAIKFTEKGEIEISISEESRDFESIFIQILVRDTGIGVLEGDREKIFENFTQADSSTKRQFGGIGLGLAIAKKYIELMGGKIWLESQAGVGSKFFFTLSFKLVKNKQRNHHIHIDKVEEKNKKDNQPLHENTSLTIPVNDASLSEGERAKNENVKEFDEIIQLLSIGDVSAIKKFNQMKDPLKNYMNDENINTVKSLIRKYEFDEAVFILKEVLYGEGR